MKMTRGEKRMVNRSQRSERLFPIQDAMLEHVDFGEVGRALDFGCGAGHLTARLAEKYDIEVTGVDVDPAQIETAVELYGDRKNLRFAVVGETSVALPDDTFDLITVFLVVHHSPHWRTLLEEMARLLRSGGWLAFHEVSMTGVVSWLFNKNKLGVYSGSELWEAVRNAGFDPVWRDADHGLIFPKHTWVLNRF